MTEASSLVSCDLEFSSAGNKILEYRTDSDEDVYKRQDRALAGEDYSNGALYFMNRRASGSAASWFDRRLTYLFAHDGRCV